MIKKLAELAKEEKVMLNYCIDQANDTIRIDVIGKPKDFVIIHNLSAFSDDEIIEITKDVIRRAKNE